MREPEISVIIPVRNGGALWCETLQALLTQDIAASIELIVIDSESTDGTAAKTETICADPQANPRRIEHRLLRIPAREFRHGGTRNLGAGQARGGLLVFLSQDATPSNAHWLIELLQPFDDPTIVGTFGRQIPRANAPISEQYSLHKSFPQRSRTFTATDFGSTNMLFCDAASAMRRSTWEQYPLPDVLMGEDAQWAATVLQAGHRIAYVASAVVLHSHSHDLWKHLKRNFDTGVALTGLKAYSQKRSTRYLHYLAEELAFALHHGGLRHLPEMAMSEATGVLGFLLGSHHARLPNWVCRRLTWFPQWYMR